VSDHDEIADYDQRQYLRLRDCLLLFEGGQIELRELVASMSALIAALERVSEADRRALQSAWWHLEEVVAQPDLKATERQTGIEQGTRLLGELLGKLIKCA